MKSSKVLTAVIVFIVLEVVNTLVNILPGAKAESPQARRSYLTRAGIFNLVLLAACLIFVYE